MHDPVEIIVPTYQGALYIAELLDSLLNQTYSPIRIIIRDDGSKDNTRKILQQYAQNYPDKISVLATHHNLGIMGNYSELLNHTQSNYIFFADQDDQWLPNKVELSMQTMKKMEEQYGKTKPLLVHTDLKVVDKELKEIARSFWEYTNLNPNLVNTNRLLLQNCVTGCTMVINRPLIHKIQPIPTQAVMHDWWIALVASYFGHIQHCTQSTILYRQHGGNTLGAVKDSLMRCIKERMDGKPENFQSQIQALVFLKQFGPLLDEKTKKMLEIFCNMKNASYIKQRMEMIRHGFFKHTLFRNLARLFLPFRY